MVLSGMISWWCVVIGTCSSSCDHATPEQAWLLWQTAHSIASSLRKHLIFCLSFMEFCNSGNHLINNNSSLILAIPSHQIFTKWVKWVISFNLRPVLAFGYSRCLRLSVCLCVCVWVFVHQPWTFHTINSSPLQARITKFGWEIPKHLHWDPFCFVGTLALTFKVKFNLKVQIHPFWAYPQHNSTPVQARIIKFGPQVPNTLVKILIGLERQLTLKSRSI